MSQQISTNTFTVAKWVVSPNPVLGTHTTIQAAINAASSGDNIFVRAGTYTEDLTLKAGVNLTGLRGDGKTPTVTIIGNCTHNTTGTVSISDFRLQTNGSFCISNTGTLVSIINILDCVISATNNTAISFTNSNAGAQINIVTSALDLGTTGIALYSMSSPGTLSFRYCNTTNSGGSSTASASSAGTVTCLYTNLLSPVSTSGTAVFNNTYSSIDTSAQNATCQSSTGSGTHTANYSSYSSGTASALSIGGTSTQTLSNATVTSSNVNAITGAGSGVLRYSLLRFSGSSAGINVPTTTPFVAANLIGTTINVSNDANAATVNLGNGLAAKSVFLGSINTTSSTQINAGSGNLSIGTGSTGTISIATSGGAVNISTDSTNNSINIATGGAVKTLVLGSLQSTSKTTIQSGSLGIQLTGAVTSANAIGITAGDLTITNGNLAITHATSSTVGQITQAGARLLHTFGGTSNVFLGSGAGNFTTGHNQVTIIGNAAGASLDASGAQAHTFVGYQAGTAVTSGAANIFIGGQSGLRLTTGNYNIGIGVQAASNYTSSESNNIMIGTTVTGTAAESNVLRIGTGTGTGLGNLNKAVICGIRGITTGVADAIAVVVDSANQLGTVSSSIRFKKDIHDIAGTDAIYELRPVQFKYKQDDREAWGLIAEEVEKVIPALVAHDSEGNCESVKYHDLPVLLLAEIQKLRKELDEIKRSL